jgi:hypothetical protein
VTDMTANNGLCAMSGLKDEWIPCMNRFLCVKNPHHKDEKLAFDAKYCTLVAEVHSLEVDPKVPDNEWWNMCVENAG